MIKEKKRDKRRRKFVTSGKIDEGGREYGKDSKRNHQRKEYGSCPQCARSSTFPGFLAHTSAL